nr:LOW QUALITY PROTEIN: lysophosphatidylserine lipase ABHD12-like [Cherax quadricarinatus]
MIKRLLYLLFLISLWLGGIALKSVIVGAILTLFVVYFIIPLVFHYSPALQRHIVFLNFVNLPKGVDYNVPDKEDLPGTRNFYLQTDKKVKVGVWHIPESLISSIPKEESSDQVAWFEKSLCDERPVVLYLHGNTSSRATAHRIELYKVLRKMDYHVIAFDYRDSPYAEPRSLHRSFVFYGFCLFKLIMENQFHKFDASYFQIFRKMPKFEWLFLNPLAKSGIDFRSDDHIAHVQAPVLILHAEDDLVVPYTLGRKLYETAQRVRPKNAPTVKFVGFAAKCGYSHKYICRAPELPEILREFFDEAVKANN